jgi:NAD+ kinase
MRIRFRVKSVFILTKIYDQDLIPKTRQIAKWLLSKDRETAFTVYIQDKLKPNKKFDVTGLIDELAKEYAANGQQSENDARDAIKQRIRYWDEPMCRMKPHIFDFVITLGGDGTVLYASWLFQRIVPPVLSFALGSLGFLTKFDFEEHEAILAGALKQGVTVSLRLRFEGTVMRSQRKLIENVSIGASSSSEEDEEKSRDLVEELIGEEKEDAHTHRPDGTYEILNEIVVDRGPNPSKTPMQRSCSARSEANRESQLCHTPRSSATMSISPQCWLMASAYPRLPDLPLTISRPEALYAIRRTP